MLMSFRRARTFLASNVKGCQENCICANTMKILLTKYPQNIIDEKFIQFQIDDFYRKFKQCYEIKTNKKNE